MDIGPRRTARMLPGRLALMYAVVVAIVLVGSEVFSLVVISVFRQSGIFYHPSTATQSFTDYLALRDSSLGWGPGRDKTAADGTRNDPAHAAVSETCISLFGDSFTWSEEVDDHEAWGSVLGSRIKCRVANYGVGGYGSDQAYLRYLSVPARSRIVLLNHLSENILRNVNQYRNLLAPGAEFNFKPRFVNQGGTNVMVPLPDIAAGDIQDFLSNPERYLTNEYFIPGGPSGNQKVKFPYTLTLLKALLWNDRLRAWGKPWYADFYLPDHPSNGLDVTVGILAAFANSAVSRDQLPIVTLIPTCRDLKIKASGGELPYEALRRRIAAMGIRHIDFGSEIARRAQSVEPESLFTHCKGHFNATGYRLLADITFDYLSGDAEIQKRLAGP